MPRVPAFAVVAAFLASLTSAWPQPSILNQSTPCPIPSWSVHNLSVTYSDDRDGAKTSFALVNMLTNTTELLSCPVIFNAVGRIDGTPEHSDLRILLSFNLDAVHVEINQTWASCASDPEVAAG